MRFVTSYSCGKDSALALHRMVQAGHQPIALLVMLNEEENRSWFHGVDRPLLEAVSDSLGIPLIECACTGEEYHTAMEEGLLTAANMGAEVAVFGDIDIEDHRKWATDRCASAGLRAACPLWRQDRLALTREVISAGFAAIIKCVDKSRTDPDLLGEILTDELIERIVAGGADACGEHGEYHTFVYDGPIFSHPLPIQMGRILDFGTHAAIDITVTPPAQEQQ
ncbi:MAG: diphthine--ammonia ligase [Bacillota bacterium]